MSSMTQKEHEQADAEGDRQDACYDTALADINRINQAII